MRSETVGLEAVKDPARRAPLDTSTHIDIDIDVDIDIDIDLDVDVDVRVYIYYHYIMHINDITGMLGDFLRSFPALAVGFLQQTAHILNMFLKKSVLKNVEIPNKWWTKHRKP